MTDRIAGLVARMALPSEYSKPRIVVPDNLVAAFKEAYGDAVKVIALSDTMLPMNSAMAAATPAGEK
jgi:DNA-directed RNA polymerase subunit H (RpoH/RPB5)